MEKCRLRLKLLPVLGIAATLLFTSCTDNDYDFNEIDSTIGIGGDGLEIPSISTDVIQLKDVLELEANGSVVEDAATGDYVFRQDGAEVAPVHPRIDRILVAKQSSSSYDVELVMAPAAGAARASSYVLKADGFIQAFAYEGDKPEEVIDLSEAEVSSEISLTVDFSDIRGVVGSFDELVIAMPAFMTLSNVNCGNQTFEQYGSKLIMKNVSTAGNLVIKANVSSLNFKEKDTSYGELSLKNGKIVMDGKVNIEAVSTDFNAGAGTGSALKIKSRMSMGGFTINAATGRFNPEISLSDLGNISVTGVPDFLLGGDVVVDLYNPQIKLSVTSDMGMRGVIDGVIKSFKNGQTLATVNVSGIPVDADGTTTVCICRRAEGVSGFSYVIENESLSDLIRTIPDKITFSANASADSRNIYRFELGRDYEIKPSYTVDAPIAFAEDANIEYRDTLDGWNDDIKDFELAEDSYISVTANVKSCVPAYLTVEAIPVDAGGNEISADELAVDVEGSVEASKDGKTETSSPLSVKISQNKKGAMKKLDGIVFIVSGKADGQGGAVTGITLNATKHTLVVDDIRIKLTGKVIGDFN